MFAVLDKVLSAKTAAQVHKARQPEETRGARPKHTLTPDEFFELFNSGIPQIRIAELTGLSRERIRQIYDRQFRELFGGKSGRERFSAYTLKRRLAQADQKAKERERKVAELNPVIDQARAAGCTVNFVLRKKGRKTTRDIEPRLLDINGRRCLIYPSISRSAIQGEGGKRRYVSVRVSHGTVLGVEAVVLRTTVRKHPEHTFVIPSKALLRAYFNPPKDSAALYIAAEPLSPYNNHFPRVDYWNYEDAWHLLPPSKRARVASPPSTGKKGARPPRITRA
jgi:AraC-like DNA-binding protein